MNNTVEPLYLKIELGHINTEPLHKSLTKILYYEGIPEYLKVLTQSYESSSTSEVFQFRIIFDSAAYSEEDKGFKFTFNGEEKFSEYPTFIILAKLPELYNSTFPPNTKVYIENPIFYKPMPNE